MSTLIQFYTITILGLFLVRNLRKNFDLIFFLTIFYGIFFLKFFRGQSGVKFWILTGFIGFSKVIIIRYLWSRFFESLQLFKKFNCQKPSVCPTSPKMAKNTILWKFMKIHEFRWIFTWARLLFGLYENAYICK